MTFTQLVEQTANRLGIRHTEGKARLGEELNIRYRQVRSDVGLQTSTRVTDVPAVITLGGAEVVFNDVQKITRVYDGSSNSPRDLEYLAFEEMRELRPGSGTPQRWSVKRSGATSVTVLLDVVLQATLDLYGDGYDVTDDLTGAQTPDFPEDFHDILIYAVLKDELIRADKQAARQASDEYQARLSKLRLWHAKALRVRNQPGRLIDQRLGTGGTSAGAGSGTQGLASYTQSGLVTFDRGTNIPFAVVAGAAKVPNLDADLLDGLDSTYLLDRANHTGTITLPSHASTHQNGGADEISVAGLSGLLADAQTPTAHAASHLSGGSDAIKLDDLATPDDNTDLNASAARHGLLRKLSGNASDVLKGDGTWGVAATPVKPFLVFTPNQNEPPTAAYATPDTRNARPVLDFDGAADEEAVFTRVLPTSYAGGGLTCTLFVAFTTALSGSVRFQAAIERTQLSTLDIDSDSFAAFQSAGGAAPGTSGHVIAIAIAFTAGAQMDDLVAGELFRIKIRRDADGTSGTDDITTDAELLGFILQEP